MPFEVWMENFLEIFNNGVFTFVTGIFVIIAVFDVPVGFGYHGIGWFTMATLSAMIIFNFGLIFKEIWQKIKEKKAELQAWWAKRNIPPRPLSALSLSGPTGKTSQVTNFFLIKIDFKANWGIQVIKVVKITRTGREKLLRQQHAG
jgi:hypothetical protein